MPLGQCGPNSDRPCAGGREDAAIPGRRRGTTALLHGTSREEEGGCPCGVGPCGPVSRGNIREEVLPLAPEPREEEWPRRNPYLP